MADEGQLSIEQQGHNSLTVTKYGCHWCAFYMNVKRRNIYVHRTGESLMLLKSVFERSCSAKVLTH